MFEFLYLPIAVITNWLWPPEEKIESEIRPLNKTYLPGKVSGKSRTTPRFVRYEKLRRR